MTKKQIIKIFKKESDCKALISNRSDGWTLVKQIDAMSQESFVKIFIELFKTNKSSTISIR